MPKGKRPPGRPRLRRMDTIKMEVREIGLGHRDWIDLVQDTGQRRSVLNAI
jgi:hypothetical protein